MDRDQLADRLRLATTRTVEFSRRFVWNELPDECRYLVSRGRAGANLTLKAGETVYPADVPGQFNHIAVLDLGGVVALLWREGKIPEWINLTVTSADESCTYIELMYCSRFTDQDHRLYYQTSDTSPIVVCGPSIPPGWKAENPEWQTGTYHKFDLYWLHRQR